MAATPQEGAGGAPNEATNGNSPPTVAPSEADSDSSAVVVDAPPASPASDDGSEASAVLVASTPRPDADEEQSSTTPTPRRPAPRAPVEEEPGWLTEPEPAPRGVELSRWRRCVEGRGDEAGCLPSGLLALSRARGGYGSVAAADAPEPPPPPPPPRPRMATVRLLAASGLGPDAVARIGERRARAGAAGCCWEDGAFRVDAAADGALHIDVGGASVRVDVNGAAGAGPLWYAAIGPDGAAGRVAAVVDVDEDDAGDDDDGAAAEDARKVADAIFEAFDSDGDGRLSRADARRLVRQLLAVGGNVRTLAGDGRAGWLTACVTVPDEDLCRYVLHRHCLLRVCYGGVGLAKKSHWHSRLVLVLVSLLWSLAANALVSALLVPAWDRVSQVIAITLVDAFGVSALTLCFYAVHSDVCVGNCSAACALNVPAVVTTALSVVLLVLLLVSLPSAELRLVCGSFFPIWGTARVTELFKLGTFWALQVQYGAYRRPDPSLVRADPYLAKLERLQRRGAADVV